jgi:hypothetical protein
MLGVDFERHFAAFSVDFKLLDFELLAVAVWLLLSLRGTLGPAS